MAKLIQVSDDDESNWYTLPGNTGAFNDEATPLIDTIFGQTYQSEEIGLISWSVEAQAFYKGFAGYAAELRQQDTSTAMTGEDMTVVTGKTYQIDAAAKQIWDRTATFTVYDGVTDVTDEVVTFDYLFGKVTFASDYTVLGDITIDGSYYTTSVLGAANSYTLTQTAEAVETSDFATVQANGGFRTFQSGLRNVALELGAFYDVDAGLRAALEARSEIIVEIDPAGDGKSIARGFFKVATEGQSGDVGALEDESTTLTLNAPSADYIPFGWQHANDTTLNTAIQVCLTAFTDETAIDVQYLHDGTNGIKGEAIVTDVSLSGSLDGMNEFTTNFMGSGATTAVGNG